MDIVKNQTQKVTTREMGVMPNAQVHSETTQVVDHVDDKEYGLYKTNQIIWFLIGLIELVVGLRVVLLLLGANNTGFANFIYSISSVFVAPFSGLFTSPSYERSFFDTAGIVALLIYPLLGYIFTSLLKILSKRS